MGQYKKDQSDPLFGDNDENLNKDKNKNKEEKWVSIIRSIIKAHIDYKPEMVYTTLLEEIKTFNDIILPTKDVVKKKINTIKAAIRKNCMRSIVS